MSAPGGPVLTQKPLPKVAVFGTGWGTSVHVPALRAAGFQITALWARTQLVGERVAAELGIPYTSSNITEVLIRRDVDFVSIVTPPHLHAEIAVKALSAGKHVLSEKPMAVSALEAGKMVTAAQYYPKLLSLVDHQLRFLPPLLRMKQLIAEGYVGTLMVAEARVQLGLLAKGEYNWCCDAALGGGVLGDIGSHIIDALSFAMGIRALSVCGQLRTYVRETDKIAGFRHITSDDYCSFELRYPGAVLGTVVLNTHCPGEFLQEIAIFGTKGRLVLRGIELIGYQNPSLTPPTLSSAAAAPAQPASAPSLPELLVSKEQVQAELSDALRQLPPASAATVAGTAFESIRSSPYVLGTMFFAAALREAFVRGNASDVLASAATFDDGFYTQKVIDAVKRSSQIRTWVDVLGGSDADSESSSPFWG